MLTETPKNQDTAQSFQQTLQVGHCLIAPGPANLIRMIEGYRAGALEKVATAFSGIAEEADAAAEAEFERLGSMPTDDEIDMGAVAEWSTEYGIQYYETMLGVRQGVLNLLAVGLHHLFEQQQLFFLRRELARDDEGTLRVAELERRLAERGIDCRSFRCAVKLYELRKAANAIKHGAGPAAKELAALRPDLFKHPALASHATATGGVSGAGPAPVFVGRLERSLRAPSGVVEDGPRKPLLLRQSGLFLLRQSGLISLRP